MPSQPVHVSIEKALLKRIDMDPETKRRGRSAFIRSAVELYLKAEERRGIDDAIRRAYSGKQDELMTKIDDLIEVQEWSDEVGRGEIWLLTSSRSPRARACRCPLPDGWHRRPIAVRVQVQDANGACVEVTHSQAGTRRNNDGACWS